MKKISHLVHTDLATKLTQLGQLAQLIEQYMAIPVQDRTWPILRNRRLLLLTDDPHLATQARFMQKELRKYLNEALNIKLIGLDIKLITLPLARFAKKTGRRPISAETAHILSSIANDINDPELRQSLLNITLAGQDSNQTESKN